MNDSSICLKPVSALLKGPLGEPAIYRIAGYQRGYRWTPQQVIQLLDDLFEFFSSSGREEKSFYCLQPLVIKSAKDHVEVVDGQQRLTTILLILDYFNVRLVPEERQLLYSITFETRSGFDQFLAKPSEEAANSNVDFFHLFQAMAAIRDWFKERRTYARDIESTLLNRTQVIWFELPAGDDPVSAFTRLNAGKIPLTNDELIRALFLRRNQSNPTEADAAQLRIATEWDLIEKELQRDAFWYFLKNKADIPHNRIRFLFELLARADGFDADANSDTYAIFYHFSSRFKSGASGIKEWLRVKEEFMRLEEWFDDRVLYHLVGYLVHERVALEDLRKVAQNATKRDFDQTLRRKIFEVTISRHVPAMLTKEAVHPLVRDRLNNLDYEASAAARGEILSILLLFNVATLVRNPASNVRFQFDSFKKQQWNIEHVRSIASEPPEAHTDRQAWLQLCLDHLDPTKQETVGLRVEIETFLLRPRQQVSDLDFTPLYEKILHHFGESTDGIAVHGIGNLALLDENTNKSYKNAPFAVKRKRLLTLDQAGTFVPICTRNVFLKCYSPNVENVMFWGDNDQEAYGHAILETLVSFFSANSEELA